jgi:hypothetical protein
VAFSGFFVSNTGWDAIEFATLGTAVDLMTFLLHIADTRDAVQLHCEIPRGEHQTP